MASKTRMLDRTPSTFGQLLDWHLDRGTRPDGTPGEKGVPWQNKAFAVSVGKLSSEGPKNERTIRNWRNGQTLPSPADFAAILQALFGGKPIYADSRAELTDKYHSVRDEDATSAPSSVLTSSLPTKPLRCIGRDDDLKPVIEALAAERDGTAVLVLGGAGMGKTTLTREAAVASDIIARFGQRRWFVELETATNAEAMEKAIVAGLGLDPASTPFATAVARLSEMPGLLVLDNLETPWDAEREKAEAVLAALHRVPVLAMLASIRGNDSPAGVRWTRRRTMHPLESPHDRRMFLDIANDIKPDDPHLAPLLALLGGVPIAIELVAQLAAAHDSLVAIHDEWQRVGSALAQRRGVDPSRLTSLEVSLELSFQSPRLSDAGRRLFSILGQLPGGAAPDDVKALLSGEAFDARQELLSTALATERGERLDLLPPVRDHARRQHTPSHADAALWREHYLELARANNERMGTAEGAAAVRRVAVELPNLDAAVRSAIGAGDLDTAVEARGGIVNAMAATGLGSIIALQELAQACRAVHDRASEAKAIDAAGYVAFARSDYEAARKAYAQALPLHRQVGSIAGEANCIRSLGDIALARSEHDAARKAYEQALPLHRQVGDILGEANCIYSLGDIALERSDHDTARKAYDQALPLHRQAGDIYGEANCIQKLGDIALERSDHDAARKAYEQALPLYRQAGAILGEANCMQRLGDIALARSDHDAARKAYEQALPLYRQVGAILGEANCIQGLGDIALARSDHTAARKAYEQALPLYRRISDILGEANCIKSLGDIALARSDHDAARKAYDQALALYEQIEEPYSIGGTHLSLTHVTQGTARADHHEAARRAWLSIGRDDLVEQHGLSERS